MVMQGLQPYHEPLGVTLRRDVMIALGTGFGVSRWSGAELSWPLASLCMLWPALGGHWVELFYLNWLRARIPSTRIARVAVRLLTWFVLGVAIGVLVFVTARALGGLSRTRIPAWWRGGIAFIGIELVAHLALQLRGRPSFYNGRG